MKYLNPINLINDGWDGISREGDGIGIISEGHGIAITAEGWGL